MQIIGDIKAARDALVELTSRIRSYLYKEPFQKDVSPPVSVPSNMVSLGLEESSSNNNAAPREVHGGNDTAGSAYQNVQPFGTAQLLKVTYFLICFLLLTRRSFQNGEKKGGVLANLSEHLVSIVDHLFRSRSNFCFNYRSLICFFRIVI